MNIKVDNSALPTAGKVDGHPPDTRALSILLPVVEEWHRQYLAAGHDQLDFAVPGTRFRASWAAKCARAMSYEILLHDAEVDVAVSHAAGWPRGTEWEEQHGRLLAEAERWAPTEPMTVTNHWTFRLGSLVHEEIQRAVAGAYPGAGIEVKVDLRPDVNGSGTMDVVITLDKAGALALGLICAPNHDAFVIVIELKSINGFGFKSSASGFKGGAQGPRHSAVVQGSLTATALDADLLVIGYFSLEQIGPDLVKLVEYGEVGRFMAGWSFTADQFRPIAEREHRRVARILDLVDAGKLAPRAIDDPEIPTAARITDPMKGSKGMWVVVDKTTDTIVQSGQTWHCAYCNHRSRCNEDGPGTPVIVR